MGSGDGGGGQGESGQGRTGAAGARDTAAQGVRASSNLYFFPSPLLHFSLSKFSIDFII